MNMKFKITGFLVILLIFAMFVQLVRSDFLIGFFKNNNVITSNSSYSSAKIPPGLNKEKFLIIFDSDEQGSTELKDNIIKTLSYMKKDSTAENLKDFKTLDNSYRAVIIAFEDMDKFLYPSLLKDYVKNGGNLLLAERPVTSDSLPFISDMLGISKISDVMDSTGIKLLSNVLIKGTGLNISSKIFSTSCLNVTLSNTSKVLALSNENIPIIWQTNFGIGNVIVFNGTVLNEKLSRGLITGLISMLIPNYIYPVMGTKLTYIDDFPAPVPGGYDKGIYEEYGITTADFYKNVWLPAILKGAKTYDLKYIGSIIEDYNNNTTPPFKSKINDNRDFILYGNELLKSGGEMGIHGYNHQSLAPKGYINQPLGYTPWKNINDMESSLGEAVKYSKAAFSGYALRVYVPPSNILSPEGREAVIKSIPDVKIISSLYSDDTYADSYLQEFQIKDGIYELPRITSGYLNDEDTVWSEYNTITSFGIFSHFIHPDDVLDSKRSEGKNWEQLLKSYNTLLSNIHTNFSWLQPVTASEGARVLKDYVDIDPFVEYKGDLINVYCKNFKDGNDYVLRSGSEIHGNGGCTVTKIDTGVYLIKADKSSFSLKLGR